LDGRDVIQSECVYTRYPSKRVIIDTSPTI
jgi:hypothetical protein